MTGAGSSGQPDANQQGAPPLSTQPRTPVAGGPITGSLGSKTPDTTNKATFSQMAKKGKNSNITKIDDPLGLVRMYKFNRASPPVGLKIFLKKKFPSMYSCTLNKVSLSPGFFQIITCLFKDKADFDNAKEVSINIAGKKYDLRAEEKYSDDDLNTPKGIFVPRRILKCICRNVPWHMSNAKCLQKVLKKYVEFDDNKLSLIEDKDGLLCGTVSIICKKVILVPNKFLEVPILDENADPVSELKPTTQFEVSISGYVPGLPIEVAPNKECRYCHDTSHYVSQCPKLRRKKSIYKCGSCGLLNKCERGKCSRKTDVDKGIFEKTIPKYLERKVFVPEINVKHTVIESSSRFCEDKFPKLPRFNFGEACSMPNVSQRRKRQRSRSKNSSNKKLVNNTQVIKANSIVAPNKVIQQLQSFSNANPFNNLSLEGDTQNSINSLKTNEIKSKDRNNSSKVDNSATPSAPSNSDIMSDINSGVTAGNLVKSANSEVGTSGGSHL